MAGWCILQNLEREQRHKVAEWPFKKEKLQQQEDYWPRPQVHDSLDGMVIKGESFLGSWAKSRQQELIPAPHIPPARCAVPVVSNGTAMVLAKNNMGVSTAAISAFVITLWFLQISFQRYEVLPLLLLQL